MRIANRGFNREKRNGGKHQNVSDLACVSINLHDKGGAALNTLGSAEHQPRAGGAAILPKLKIWSKTTRREPLRQRQ